MLADTLDAIPRESIAAAITHLAARLLEPAPVTDVDAAEPRSDELLTVDEVAKRLRTERKFVYNHARELGGVRLSKRKLRFSARKVERYLEAKRCSR